MSRKLMDLVINACKSQSKYLEVMPDLIKHVDKGTISECKQVIDSIKDLISDKKYSPSCKILALDLFQACMLLNKPNFFTLAETRILPTLAKLASRSPALLFPDSSETKEKERESERFLHKLLNFIYIWANEFSSEGGKTSEFTKAFYKLRETVTFPDRKVRSNTRSSTIPPAPIKTSRPQERVTLKYVLGILELLETMHDPMSNEAGLELTRSLEEVLPNIEASMKLALTSNDRSTQDKVSKVLDRVNKVLHRSCSNRYSVPAPLNTNLFSNDIVGIDFGFDSGNNASKTFNLTGFKSPSFSSNSSFVELKANSFVFPESFDSVEHVERLRRALADKDKRIGELEKKNAELENQVQVLMESLNKYKELAKNKESECVSLMSSMSKYLGKEEKRVEKGQENGIKEEVIKDQQDDRNFCLAMCDRYKIILENQHVLVSFEGYLENDVYIIVLKVLNVTDFPLKQLELDVESAFGFDLQFIAGPVKIIQALGEVNKEIRVKNLCVTDLIPLISVKFSFKNEILTYNFRLPINICKFCKPLTLELQTMWDEFELLTFDTDTCTIPCNHSLKRCKKLLKMSQNMKVFSKSSISILPENQILTCIELNKLVYILLSLKQHDQQATIEVRSESLSIRKSFIIIISNQLK